MNHNTKAADAKGPSLRIPSSKVNQTNSVSNSISLRPSKNVSRPWTSTMTTAGNKTTAVSKQPEVKPSSGNATTLRTVRTTVTTFTTRPRTKLEKPTAALFNVTNFTANTYGNPTPSTKTLAGSVSSRPARAQISTPTPAKVQPPRKQKVYASPASGCANKSSLNSTHGGSPAPRSQSKPQRASKEISAPILKKSSVKSVIPLKDRPIPSECVRCEICMRGFLPDRISKHREACLKMESRPKKVFNAIAMRTTGTDQESYIRRGAHKKEVPVKKTNWRAKHEEFLNNVREAKKVQDHLARGGKLSDLPPPRPSENPDYIPCPHCGRKFNESAAERHIPKCANIISNKKITSPSKKR